MRILAFTDFHSNLEAFQRARQTIANDKPDIVVVAGDIADHDEQKAKLCLNDLAEAGSAVYFVAGNMDSVGLLSWLGSGNVHGLHGRSEYCDTYCLLGLGGSPHGAFSTPIEYDEEAAATTLEEALENYHGGNIILVTHCPPKDTKLDRVVIGQHIGSLSVRKFIENKQPILVVSGHVHEARGVDKIGSTVLVNPGPTRSGNYASVDIEKDIIVNFGKFK